MVANYLYVLKWDILFWNIFIPVKSVCFAINFSKSLAFPLCLTILSRAAVCVTILGGECSNSPEVREYTMASTIRSITGSNFPNKDYLNSLRICYKTHVVEVEDLRWLQKSLRNNYFKQEMGGRRGTTYKSLQSFILEEINGDWGLSAWHKWVHSNLLDQLNKQVEFRTLAISHNMLIVMFFYYICVIASSLKHLNDLHDERLFNMITALHRNNN